MTRHNTPAYSPGPGSDDHELKSGQAPALAKSLASWAGDKAVMACSGRGFPRASRIKSNEHKEDVEHSMSVTREFFVSQFESSCLSSYPGRGGARPRGSAWFTRMEPEEVLFSERVRIRHCVQTCNSGNTVWHTVALLICQCRDILIPRVSSSMSRLESSDIMLVGMDRFQMGEVSLTYCT